MSKKVLVLALSLVILASACPVAAMVSASAKRAKIESSCEAVPLSASEITHYQQMQSTAEAKGLLLLQGGNVTTSDWVFYSIAVAFCVGIGILVGTA